MKFGTVRHQDSIKTVLEREGMLVDLYLVRKEMFGDEMPWGKRFLLAYASGDERVIAVCSQAISMDLSSLPTLCEEGVEFLPPLPDARQVHAVGLNFVDHCEEQGVKPPQEPRIFSKLVSSLIGHRMPICHWGITKELDYEGELAVVIGKKGRLISEDEALDFCFGYTIMNDVTARDLQRNDRQWTRSKGLDTFGPMGPFIATLDEVPDPDNLKITTIVNGEVRQDSSTQKMTFCVSKLVSYISTAITLEPGDIISTGTPAGVGVFRSPPVFLKAGDVVRITIGNIGTLENEVVSEEGFLRRPVPHPPNPLSIPLSSPQKGRTIW
jgi:acylpyruvate hydrolase